MEKEELEKLIDGKPPQVKMKAVTLYNAYAQNITAYRSEPTATKLRDWESSEEALNKYLAVLSREAPAGLETLADVLAYLKASGWKVTKPSLYRHHKEGRLVPQPDGTYQQKTVDRYASTWLKQQSTGKRKNERLDELQREKLEMELQNLRIENRRKERLDEKEAGSLVPRAQLEIELATRAGILEAGLKHMIQSRVAEWIRLVAGDMKKVGELIDFMSRDLDEHINSYARVSEYEVFIDAEEQPDIVETEEMIPC